MEREYVESIIRLADYTHIVKGTYKEVVLVKEKGRAGFCIGLFSDLKPVGEKQVRVSPREMQKLIDYISEHEKELREKISEMERFQKEMNGQSRRGSTDERKKEKVMERW